MSLGACLISNQPANMADALLQDRIDGLSWQEIADKYQLGSPGAARNAFKKFTGITDFKIKGKELQKVIDSGMIDDLKKATPKVPKAKLAQSNVDEVVANAPASSQAMQAPQVYEGFNDIVDFKTKVVNDAKHAALNSVKNMQTVFKEQYGQGMYNTMVQNASQTLGQLNKLTGIPIPDLDAWKFWNDVMSKQGNIWKAYEARPTSFIGFDEVQKLYWRYRRAGVTDDLLIHNMTDIPQSVIKLIQTKQWTVATPGSTTYVGYQAPTPKYGGSSYSSPTYSSELKGESAKFSTIRQNEVDQWIATYGNDLDSGTLSAFKRYTGSYYHELNSGLRTGTATSGHLNHAQNMSAGMKPMPRDAKLFRGVDRNAFPNGQIPEVGDTYIDKGFMSSSYGDSAAFTREIELVLDVPAGTPARGVTNISNFGKAEREIIIDREVTWVVMGVQQIQSFKWKVFMRAVL